MIPGPPPPARPRHASRAARLFRAMLALYPGEFRDEYGREMALVFADRLHAAPGPFERLRIVIEAAWGVLAQAPREHAAMIVQDLRYALRGLRKEPTFAATVIVTLALGIGANIAVFQLIDAVRLRSLPVRSPAELAQVRIAGGNGGAGITNGEYAELTRPMWEAIATHQRAFSGLFAWGASDARVGEPPELRRAQALYVSGAFFDVLGLAPWGGRLLGGGDGGACPASRAVLSHRFWNQEFGGGPWRAGQRLHVNGVVVEVIGVTLPASPGSLSATASTLRCRSASPRKSSAGSCSTSRSWAGCDRDGRSIGRRRTSTRSAEASSKRPRRPVTSRTPSNGSRPSALPRIRGQRA